MLLLTTSLSGRPANGTYLLSFGDEIAVDLVGEDDDAPLEAQSAQSQQILLGPNVAGRVLRVTEDQRVGVEAHLRLEIIPIDRVATVVDIPETVGGQRERFTEIGIEPTVDGGRHQNLGSRR